MFPSSTIHQVETKKGKNKKFRLSDLLLCRNMKKHTNNNRVDTINL